MGDRGRELPHGGDAAGVRQIRLYFALPALAVAGFGFRPLAIGQIQHERDALVSTFLEEGAADQHRDTAAVLAKILLLVRWHGSGCLQDYNGPRVALAPFPRRQVCPADTAGQELLAVVSHDAEQRVVGLDDPAV